MYKLIVFDLDGTLLDTLDDLASAVNYALGAYGLPARTVEEVRTFVGNGAKNLIHRAVGDNHAQEHEILSTFRTYYQENNAVQTRAYDGVLPVLQILKAQGVQMAILSNKPDGATKALGETYFSGLFDCVMGENEANGIRKKPAPDALYAIMERFGVTKTETLYVGDSEVDIQTANNAGVACLSVLWGFREESLLVQHGATRFAREPKEILSVLDKEV